MYGSVRTAEQRSESARKAAATRAIRRADELERAKSLEPVKVGDIFRCSWGYDQTNVDFYEVLSVSASGRTVKVAQVHSQMAEDGRRVVPARGSFRSEVATKQLRPNYYNGGWAFKVASYADAYSWDGQPAYDTIAAGDPGR